jgi:RimJ/RimL family protein N-acetyltransferase
MAEEKNERVVFLAGERIYLAPVELEYAPLYQLWLNNPQTRGNLLLNRPLSLNDEEKWVTDNSSRSDSVVLAVKLFADSPEDDQLIGNVGLHGIDQTHRFAEFGLFIGPTELRGQGYGTEMTRLTLKYGFETLNLHRVWLKVFEFNEAGIATYKKCGFVEEGRARKIHWKGDCWHDDIWMGILAEEYFGN